MRRVSPILEEYGPTLNSIVTAILIPSNACLALKAQTHHICARRRCTWAKQAIDHRNTNVYIYIYISFRKCTSSFILFSHRHCGVRLSATQIMEHNQELFICSCESRNIDTYRSLYGSAITHTYAKQTFVRRHLTIEYLELKYVTTGDGAPNATRQCAMHDEHGQHVLSILVYFIWIFVVMIMYWHNRTNPIHMSGSELVSVDSFCVVQGAPATQL